MEAIIEAKNLTKKFPLETGIFGAQSDSSIHAVDQVNFKIKKGETFGLVGESGCGKTTVAKLILQLLTPTEGTVIVDNVDIFAKPKSSFLGKIKQIVIFPLKIRHLFEKIFIKIVELRIREISDRLRTTETPPDEIHRKIQLIFQDPYSSLNPRMTVYDIIGEPLDIHNLARGEAKKKRILELMKIVGLAPFHLYRYPHEFSGGQRQRVVIARALAVEPEILIMDEPVSALDVSVRAQVLNLLEELQKTFGLTYIFISHDLSVVRHVCNRVGVMYLGQIVELGQTDALFDHPQHPYAAALCAAVPIPDPRVRKEKEILSGEVPTPIDPPPHCRFAKRCKYSQQICFEDEPPLNKIHPEHWVACFYPEVLRGTDHAPFGSPTALE